MTELVLLVLLGHVISCVTGIGTGVDDDTLCVDSTTTELANVLVPTVSTSELDIEAEVCPSSSPVVVKVTVEVLTTVDVVVVVRSV